MLVESIKRFLVRHWIAFTVGFTGTAIGIWIEYPLRGRGLIGGEWLILPFLLFVSIKWHKIMDRKREIRRRQMLARKRRMREEKRREDIRRYIVNVQ